jgi:protein-tyrosine phosphatase
MGEPMRERKLALTGAVNFRDIGGYRSADGRTLTWGAVLRSDSLAELTEADQATVRALALRSLFDLRHESERIERPNRLGAGAGPLTHAIGFFPNGSEALMAGVRARTLSKDEARTGLLGMYRHLPVAHAPVYAQLLQTLLLPGALPALIHCTSGKDRTGFGIAVLMLALGVPRETILEDYVLTNHYRRDLGFMLGTAVDPAVLDVIKAADPAYLHAAFDVIDSVWGGTPDFLRYGLGLSVLEQTRLQHLLLEG